MLTYPQSTGKTPDEISKQVLAIAPIVPGQKASDTTPTTQEEAPKPVAASQPAPATKSATPAPSESFASPETSTNLIDFGNSNPTTTHTEPSQKSRDQAASVQKSSALDDMSSLREPLQPVIHRYDSIEGGEETFVDAES